MRITMVLWVAFLVLLSGCSHRKPFDEALSLEKHCTILNTGCQETGFTMQVTEVLDLPLQECHKALFDYPAINGTPVFSSLPAGDYVLYCPNTGCPFQPEYIQQFRCSEKGVMAPYFAEFSELMPEDRVFNMQIMLWGVPGFSSDWYLLQQQGAKKKYHATLVYQPIVAENSKKEKVRLVKKECGGNVLELWFSGFQPGQEVRWDMKCGEILYHSLTRMDACGEHMSIIIPDQHIPSSGICLITVMAEEEPLQVSCTWDTKTLLVKRTQPPSFLFQALSSRK